MVKGIERREKCYVEVIADHMADGRVEPLAVIWEDGRVFPVDKVKGRQYAASMRVGGHGMRYTVRMGGKDRFIWLDDEGWYVERIVHDGIVSLVSPGDGVERIPEGQSEERKCMSSFIPIGIDQESELMDHIEILARRRGLPVVSPLWKEAPNECYAGDAMSGMEDLSASAR